MNRLNLTKREFETMVHVANGRSYKQIALILETSPRTIEAQVQKARARLGAKSRAHAVAMLCGAVAPDPEAMFRGLE